MMYRLFGWWVRWQACKCAAVALAGREEAAPLAWSFAVFFEKYICDGAEGTLAFAPKEGPELNVVSIRDGS